MQTLRQAPTGTGFWWLPERQIMFHDGRIYTHDGPTETLPSHDLAHLLVAMSSNLPWCPSGSDAEVRISEFNAAVLENLLSYTYEHVTLRPIGLEAILPRTLRYACWFVEKHYAPFPVPLEDAFGRFCMGINVEVMTTLSHYFFMQKERERQSEGRDGAWEVRLTCEPRARLDPPIGQFQALIQSALQFMRARQPQGPGRRAFEPVSPTPISRVYGSRSSRP